MPEIDLSENQFATVDELQKLMKNIEAEIVRRRDKKRAKFLITPRTSGAYPVQAQLGTTQYTLSVFCLRQQRHRIRLESEYSGASTWIIPHLEGIGS